MKPAESQQVEFIKDCLRKGEQRKHILAKFRKKWQTVATRTFDTRLKAATAAMGSEIKAIQSKAEESIAKEAEVLKSKIMSSFERQEWLCKIVSGEIKAKQPFVISGKIMEYQSEPTHGDRIRALAELNKMDGSYSPEKHLIVELKLPSWLGDDK